MYSGDHQRNVKFLVHKTSLFFVTDVIAKGYVKTVAEPSAPVTQKVRLWKFSVVR